MEATKEKNLHLLEIVGQKISVLKRAAEDVETTKKNLQGAAADVKAQIHDSISRHLEAMRNREMWLLGQAEAIQHIKEESLSQQLSEIHQAIGALQSITLLLEESNGVEFLEAHVEEKVEELCKLNLSPEESEHFKFSGQNFQLMQMIHKFGVLDSGSSQLEKQVCTLFQGLHLAGSGGGLPSHKKNPPAFYSPTGSNQDWILKEGQCNSSKQIQFQHPLAKLSLTEWLLPTQATPSTKYGWKAVQENLPVEQWLSGYHKSEQHAEESAGMFSAGSPWNTSTGMDQWLLKSASQKIQPSDLFGYYKVVKQSDDSQWLRAGSGAGAPFKLNTARIGETYAQIAASGPDQWLAHKNGAEGTPQPLRTSLIGDAYAKIAASALEHWLVGKGSSAAEKMLQLKTAKSEDCSEFCNCLEGECEAEGMEFSDASSDLSDWLSVKKEDGDDSAESGFTVKPVDVEDVADWLLNRLPKGKEALPQGSTSGVGKYYEDLCNTSMTKWLPPAATLPKFNILNADDTGVKNYTQKLSAGPDHMWLCQVQSGSEPKDVSVSSGVGEYLQALSGDDNQWLIQEPEESNMCKRLARSSTSPCKNCPKMCSNGLFKVFENVANHSSDSWLLPAKEAI